MIHRSSTTEQEGSFHCPVLANPLGKEVWRDPMCLVTQVVTQRFLKKRTRYINPRSCFVPLLPIYLYPVHYRYVVSEMHFHGDHHCITISNSTGLNGI